MKFAVQKYLVAVAAIAVSTAPVWAQNASVRVVHGIPGADVSPDLDPALPVDVLVNDAVCLLQGFTFGELAGPFTLPAAEYNVKIFVADTLAPCSGDAVIDADVPIAAGENATIIAHLTASGELSAAKFVNDVSATEAGSARLIVHHAAAAPAVDLSVRGGLPPSTQVNLMGVPNGAQAAAEVSAGAQVIGVTAPGDRFPLFTRTVRLVSGQTYLAYAVGSLTNNTFTIIVEPVSGLAGITILF